MRTRGSSVATLLLLVVYLTTRVDSRTTKSKRPVPTASLNENDDDQKNANGRRIVPVALDLQVDQTELLVLNMDDLKDVENIQDAMSVIGYEPQKVNTKRKRKIETGSDSRALNSHTTIATAPEIDLLYYEIPQIKKSVVTPLYPQKSSFESLHKQNASDFEYVYPVASVRQAKQRFPKLQYPVSSAPSEDPKPKASIFPKLASHRRPFSSESLRPSTPSPVRTTPTIVEALSTISTRRGRARKRVEKAPSHQDASKSNDGNNYPVIDASRARSAIHSEDERKARRPVAKPDIAPRSFARSPLVRLNQEGSLEKLADQGATLTRRANSRNQWNALRGNVGEPNSHSEVAEAAKGAGPPSNRRLYERKSRRQRPSVQVIRNDEAATERSKESESFKVTTPVPYTTEKPVAREDANVRPLQTNYGPEEATRTLSVAPTSLDGYQNAQTPDVTVSSGGLSSTAVPFTSLSTYYSNPGYYYQPTSTTASVRDYEVSSASPWKSNLKERDVAGDREVDGVADATGVADEDSGEAASKMEKEDHYQTRSDDGSREDSREASSDASTELGRSDEGEGDIEAESTHVSLHKDQRHQGDKGSAGHGGDAAATGSGGNGEVEMGGDEERSEGHKDEKGEKGKKGYKSRHEHEKANKGHHDKEKKSSYFDEKEGKEKKHDDEGGYHQEHQRGEKGEKGSEYDEKGDHQKGYSTKGQHTVHKKDEFEKYTEFFDDFNEDGETEKEGESHHDHETKKGGSHKISHHDMKDEKEAHGKETKFEKGKEYNLKKGHKESEGQDGHHSHKVVHGEKGSQEAKKSRSHSSGDVGESKSDHKSR
nr:filaggrin-2-like [Megalopta genalis]